MNQVLCPLKANYHCFSFFLFTEQQIRSKPPYVVNYTFSTICFAMMKLLFLLTLEGVPLLDAIIKQLETEEFIMAKLS